MLDLAEGVLREFTERAAYVDRYWVREGLTLHIQDKPGASTERMRRYRLRHGAALKAKERAYYKEWKKCKTTKTKSKAPAK